MANECLCDFLDTARQPHAQPSPHIDVAIVRAENDDNACTIAATQTQHDPGPARDTVLKFGELLGALLIGKPPMPSFIPRGSPNRIA